jgi:O-antigen/teichoic acid export membrane protein
MGIEKRLKIDFTWVLAGNGLYSACQWLIVLVLAKLGTSEQVGEYALGLAISGPIILFANLQLRSLLASDVIERFRFNQYLTFRLLSLGLALIVVAAVATFATDTLRRAGIVLLVAAAQSLEFVSETFYGFMQKHDRMDQVSRSLMYRGPLSLAALCVAMYFTRDLVWALVALTLGRLFVLLVWDARVAGSPVSDLSIGGGDLNAMVPLLRTALPLGVISMLASLNANIPRYFVQADRGTAELGVFSAIAALLSAGTLVVSAYGQAMFVPVARACAALDRSGYRKCVWIAVMLGVVLGGSATLISAVCGKAILSHLFRPAYAQHVDVLVRLMIAGTITFVALGLGFVMTAAQTLRPQVPLLIVTGMVAAAGSAWLIPERGLVGAADAVVIAALVQLAGTTIILLKIDQRFQRAPEIEGVPLTGIQGEAV